MKLRINGFFDVPEGTGLDEAIFRLSVRLKQMARERRFAAVDWLGVLELVDEAPEEAP